MFGITYKPFGKTKTYETPSGPSFEDELEFERELASQRHTTNKQPTVPDDDDDFDFSPCKVDIKIIEPLDEPVTEITISEQVSQAEVVQKSDPVSSYDVMEASRLAMQSICEVYSNGLGDHEVWRESWWTKN